MRVDFRRSRIAAVWASLFLAAAASNALALTPLEKDLKDRADYKFLNTRFLDEAKAANYPHQDLLNAGSTDDTLFEPMDGGITSAARQQELLSRIEPFFGKMDWQTAKAHMARGRNNWIVWTAGNDRFWSYMTRVTLGGLDFLKTISDYKDLPSTRANRWVIAGLVNEPCFDPAAVPNKDRWGLWLPTRKVSKNCPADPFQDPNKYPGIQTGSRGQTLKFVPTAGFKTAMGLDTPDGQTITKDLEIGSFYGYPTGVVGLRLFPNPDFDETAASNWDPVKYYTDAAYYYNPNLIRPYRVGMACAFCHVGPSPTNPPADFENPTWANLNSNPGAQYFWVDRIFDWNWKADQNSFIYQLLHTARPGTVDTSLVSSDMINNPRTMNAVYNFPARVAAAGHFHNLEQLLSPGEKANAQFSTLMSMQAKTPGLAALGLTPSSDLQKLSTENPDPSVPNTVISPRVLKDGSDSVGALGALNRVYVNIGLYSEEWIQDFIPLVGGPNFIAFNIKQAEQKSYYWNATVAQTPDLAMFFLASATPDLLKMAPGASGYLLDEVKNKNTLDQGKQAFAFQCAKCHSSKLPQAAYNIFNDPNDPTACVGPKYMTCWNRYWKYTMTDDFKKAMLTIVNTEPAPNQEGFLDNNFLSTDLRVPITLIDGQLCSPVATNAIKDDTWDNFSSNSYKTMKSPGKHVSAVPDKYLKMHVEQTPIPGGGRGYIRPASLVSVWSTAPFLQNNSLGKFNAEGTVAARIDSFNDSIDRLLNPQNRARTPQDGEMAVTYTTRFNKTLPGFMDVTTHASYIKIPSTYFPKFIYGALKNELGQMPADPDLPPVSGKIAGFTPPTKNGRAVASDSDPLSKKTRRSIASFNLEKWFSGKVASAEQWWEGLPKSEDTEEEYPDLQTNSVAEYIYLGPIPKGVPVNLIANVDLKNLKFTSGGQPAMVRAGYDLIKAVKALRTNASSYANANQAKNPGLTRAQLYLQYFESTDARDLFLKDTIGSLLAVSKCNDFVVNRGHYFGTIYGPPNMPDGSVDALSDSDKAALIEYMKFF